MSADCIDFASMHHMDLAVLWAVGSALREVFGEDFAEQVNQRVVLPEGVINSCWKTLSAHQVHEILLLSRFTKKWECGGGVTPELAQAALEGFVSRNAKCDPRPIRSSILFRMRELLDRWLPPVDESPLPRLGPGAVQEGFSYLRKRQLLPEFCEYYWDPMHSSAPDNCTARLCAVPKDTAKARLITVEPLWNTLVQQAARSYIIRCYESGPLVRSRFWRQFWRSAQLIQRSRALESSVSCADATIDLSDASDGISYSLVASVMPSHIMAWLDEGRSTYFLHNGERIPLNIYAGMGNATTFIVETLIFCAYVVAVGEYYGFSPRVTVFGDDIICNNELATRGLLESGSESFFRINSAKSFIGTVPFRESCGIFAFQGQDVSPVVAKGYRTHIWEERVALGSFVCRLANSSWLSENLLAHRFAATRALPNLRHLPENYPAWRVWSYPFDQQDLRINSRLHVRETRLPIECPRVRYLPAEHHWMVPAANIDAIHTSNRMRGMVELPLRGLRRASAWLPTT